MGPFAAWERIQRATQLQNFFSFQSRIIANVKAVKMHMIHCRIVLELPIAQKFLRIGLPELIATARSPTAKLDAKLMQQRHHPLTKNRIGFFEHQGKSIIAASFDDKIGLIFVRIEIVEK